MFNLLKRKVQPAPSPLKVDVHSHLLPGIDDGVKTCEQATEIILYLQSKGYSTLVTTPHIISDIYPNTAASIMSAYDKLVAHLKQLKINMDLRPAAEYYLDETLIHTLQSGDPVLTLPGRYLLFETNFLNEPLNLKDFIFLAFTKGYKPVLAHPERYLYLHQDFNKVRDLVDRGVLFQVNITSLTGYYSKPAQVMARRLIDERLVHWLGTDCHHMIHARMLDEMPKNKYFQKALNLPLLNNTIE